MTIGNEESPATRPARMMSTDIRRAKELAGGTHYVDLGTSGGVWPSSVATA